MAKVIKPTDAQIKSWVKGSTTERIKYSSGIVVEQIAENREVEFVLDWMYENHYQLIGVQPFGTSEGKKAIEKLDVFKDFNQEQD